MIIRGTDSKKLLFRGIGPSLQIPGSLQDPVLTVYRGNSVIASNDNWADSQQPEIAATGLAPADEREAALLMNLSPDTYTIQLRGAQSGRGIGLVEVYDLASPGSELINISTRSLVGTGDNVMIAGFIVGPDTGRGTRVLVRGIGPSIPVIANRLMDPMLELHDGNGGLLATNDDWKTNEAEVKSTGIPPTDDRESALVADLAPGTYTAIVRGKNDSTGVATPPAYNRILSNAIYGNSAVGIDLGNDGPTANDEGDADIGANALQNAPVIESTEIANSSVTIKGSLESTGNTHYTLQYFSESLDLVRPLQTYLGTSIVTTDDNGNAQFSATFAVSDTNVSFNMTATSADGNTSEFSRNAPRMLNISTRANVQTSDRVLIAGFIVRSNLVNRQMIFRGLGPSLQSGGKPLPGTLSDPSLEYHYGNGSYSTDNDNWRDASNSGFLAIFGLTPTDEREAALFYPYVNGPNSIVIRGANGETGIALAEVYDGRAGSFGGFGDVSNISTRGFVGTGDDAMIAGTILEQTVGTTRIVVRALGPSLAAAGVTDPLADPVLQLRDASGAIIAENDNWRDGQAGALTAVGLAPSNDKESAIFMRLPSGAYRAIVRGKDNAAGIGLVELYNLH